MKLETSPKVTKSKRSLHWCRSISKKYLCTFYYSISQKVITLSGRRFITVSGVLLHYRAVITLSGVFYYIIGQLLQYRAFITLSVGTALMVACTCTSSAFLLACLVGDVLLSYGGKDKYYWSCVYERVVIFKFKILISVSRLPVYCQFSGSSRMCVPRSRKDSFLLI